jgi:acyl-coenzyme A synthetase/AMP-(fatty) acid ligase
VELTHANVVANARQAQAELEHLLLAHPAVADAAVVPRPDPLAGEVPRSPSGKLLRRVLVEAERLAGVL